MRTTLSLDPDVAKMVEDEVYRARKPMKQVVNEALRRGLAPRPAGDLPAVAIEPHHTALKPGVDPGRLNALLDELEDDATLNE